MKKTLVIFLLLSLIVSGFAQVRPALSLELSEISEQIAAGKFDDAEISLAQLKINSEEERALVLNANGSLNMNKGRNDLALENLLDASSIWSKNNKSQTQEAAQTQMLLGNLFRVTGKYAQAEEQLNMALIIRQNSLSPTDERIAASYNDLGLVYTLSDPDKALTYYEKALTIYEKNHGLEDPKIAISKTNIGYMYSRLELFGDAINNFEAALKIWEKVYSGPHPSKAFVMYNLGQTYDRMKNLSNARIYYEKAIAVYKQSYGDKHPDVARVNNSLGNLAVSEGNYPAALHYFQNALIANHSDFNSADVNQNPPAKNYYDGNVLLYTLMFKAQTFENIYFKKSLRFKDLLQGIRALESADSLITHLRQHISNESDKISLGAIASEVYADGVRISMESAVAAVKKKPFYEKAFYFSEKSKAAVLLGAISDSNAKTYAGIPQSLTEEEKRLKAAIALCSQRLAEKPDGEIEKQLRENFYSLNRTYETFTKNLEQQYPSYFNLKFNSHSPSIVELQRTLPATTLVISYFIDDKNSRLYLFEITHKAFKVEERSITKEFERNVTGFRNSMMYSELKTFKKASFSLSKLLLPGKIPASINDLVIVPAGKISTLPFEALVTSNPDDAAGFELIPYVIKKYAVRYEFSTELILQKKKTGGTSTPSVLLCAPVTFSENSGMPDLPGTETEIKDLKNLFDQKQLPNLVMLNAAADEKDLKATDLQKFSFLHFATHGVVDETNPELSRIFLASASKDEDGYLFTGEIYNLQLNANLVTLSACETGLGKISQGEGVIGLSRALVYAGAKNCLVSFWKVSDESTALMMTDYYKQLIGLNEYNLSATLQKVKVTMISHGKFSSPYYWAPFILIGY